MPWSGDGGVGGHHAHGACCGCDRGDVGGFSWGFAKGPDFRPTRLFVEGSMVETMQGLGTVLREECHLLRPRNKAKHDHTGTLFELPQALNPTQKSTDKALLIFGGNQLQFTGADMLNHLFLPRRQFRAHSRI